MSFKKVSKIAILFFCAVFAAVSTVSYAFLVYKTSNQDNTIATAAQFPKPFVKVYAAAGPLYKGFFEEAPDYESPNYKNWLNNACQYILSDLDGKAAAGAIGSGYSEYKNISNLDSTLVNIESEISSFNFESFNDHVLGNNEPDEHGTLVHNIVAIGTPINQGLNNGKISLNGTGIQITQIDIFKSTPKKDGSIFEYKLPRSSDQLDIGKNRDRVAAYNYVDGKYVLITDNSTEADLVIFDIGNKGYTVENWPQNAKEGLEYIEDLLLGKKPHAKEQGNGWDILWVGGMYDLVMGPMKANNDFYCKLDRTECEVTFTYNDYIVPTQKFTIRYGDPQHIQAETSSETMESTDGANKLK